METVESIKGSRQCRDCNCYEDCLKAAGTKKWVVEKDNDMCQIKRLNG